MHYEIEFKPKAIKDLEAEFEKIEDILENYGLAKLMRETDDERLSKKEALKCYDFIKDNPMDN